MLYDKLSVFVNSYVGKDEWSISRSGRLYVRIKMIPYVLDRKLERLQIHFG